MKIVKLLCFVTSLCILSSCGKDEIKEPEISDLIDTTTTPIVADTIFYKLRRVENFKGDTTDNDPESAKALLLFSLIEKKHMPATYLKTTKWDLSFSSLYNSFLSGNNSANLNNYGSGSSATGGITIVKKKFEDVIDIPADDQFSTGKDVVGTDDWGAFGTGTGWYLYDFGGAIVGDGSYDRQHVAYALGEGATLANGDLVEPRTIIVRTATGHYAKIKMISVYKNAFTIDKWFRKTPHMYFTFEYVLVPKASKKFEIR